MRDDKIFTVAEYRDYIIEVSGENYDENLTNQLVSLKIKSTILGVLGKDNRPASKKKIVVIDIIAHLNRCLDLF